MMQVQQQRAAAPSDRGRRIAGWVLWSLGMVIGASILFWNFAIEPLMMGLNKAVNVWIAMGLGALLAVPAVIFYMLVPILVDRYDPEPFWALAMIFLWGAIAACGFSVEINTAMSYIGHNLFGKGADDWFAAVFSAPFVEEAFKGIALVGLLVFFRREFDGLVDGVVYATFVALGFAAFENVVYYARGALSGGGGGLIGTFVLRGIFSPWCHPVFTSMTGLGVGLARETNKTWLKFFAPVFGYACAVMLHMTWNGFPHLFGKNSGAAFIAMYFLFWLPFVFIFFVIVIFLVRREGQIIRKFLEDEVLIGNMSKDEVDLVCSPFGRMKALMGAGGFKGRAFVDAASRLALSKWHATRAMEGRKMTISADFIVPLRQELAKIRYEIQQRR